MAMLYGPLSTCPRCNHPECYGRCLVTVKGLLFKCNRCGHHEAKELPPLKKKIIYIDQFALSNMVKQTNDPFWSELYALLKTLKGDELITCPYSPIHTEESLFAPDLRESLKGMYRSIAGDDEFESLDDIEKHQLTQQLKKYLGKPEAKDGELEERSGCKRNPHRWSDIFHIHVDFDVNEAFVDRLQQAKDGFFDSMKGVCDYWKKNPQTFDEDVATEQQSFRENAIAMYRQITGGNPDNFHFWTPLRAEVVNWLVRWVMMLDEDEQDPIGVVEAFFASPECEETPFLYLWSRLWAKIAELVRNPKGSRKPQPGDYYDANLLAYYAPYCHAMFIDKGYRAISEDPRVNVKRKFGTVVFSGQKQNRDDFLELLREIRNNMTDEHRQSLQFVYPFEGVGQIG